MSSVTLSTEFRGYPHCLGEEIELVSKVTQHCSELPSR